MSLGRAVGEEAREIFRLDLFAHFRSGEAGEVVAGEEVGLLDHRKAHVGVNLEEVRKGGRPAPRGADHEGESLDVVDARHHAGTPSRGVWLRHNSNQATLRQAGETLSALT